MKTQPIKFAIIGLGGFAQAHHKAILALENKGIAKLVCASGRDPAKYQKFIDEMTFKDRGVQVFSDYLEMLDKFSREGGVAIVPTPIHLHMPMHEEVIKRKIACYLEKPPTLDIRELDAMMSLDKSAKFTTMVGFNMISDPVRLMLKERLVHGEFGKPVRVSFLGISPRYTPYYSRASWAGRIDIDGHLVLDSCIGNALAHNIHNILMWAEHKNILSWADIIEVEADLYRGHAVQNFDTVFARAFCRNGVELRIAATHACEMPNRHIEIVECEKATIHWQIGSPPIIKWKDGHEDKVTVDSEGGSITRCIEAYIDYITGKKDRPLTTLKDCIPYVSLFDLIYVAAGDMKVVPEEHIRRTVVNPGEEQVGIIGVTEACEKFIEKALFPAQQNLPWAGKNGKARIEDIKKFGTIIEAFRKKYAG